MKHGNKGIINPLSRRNLKELIKCHGMQSWMFDERLLVFQWDELEYEFYIYEGCIYLQKINVLRDVQLASLEQFESAIQKPKHELPGFLK